MEQIAEISMLKRGFRNLLVFRGNSTLASCAVLGRVLLQKLTPQQVQSFYAKKIKEGYKAITIASFHKVLHKALDTEVRWSLVSKNVCDVVSVPRVEEFEIHPSE